jgi:hypothetical protein
MSNNLVAIKHNSMSADSIRESLVFRLRERARIRRQISTRKSVSEGAPDRISDLLEEAADELDKVYYYIGVSGPIGFDDEHIPDDWNEDRIDTIGQNGNDGLHYIDLDK